jgi:hypothetical protein
MRKKGINEANSLEPKENNNKYNKNTTIERSRKARLGQGFFRKLSFK